MSRSPRSTPPEALRFLVSIDRREPEARSRLRRELNAWLPGVHGVTIRWVTQKEAARTPDQGAFRDFVPFFEMRGPDQAALDYICEELVSQYGWLIDLRQL